MTGSKITANHFALLGQPERFAVDRASLESAYRKVQSSVHPDRFVRAMDAERRIAMQLSAQANEAFQTLGDPVARALYLCRLQGVHVDTDRGAGLSLEFLEEQMRWRELLDDAREVIDDARAYADRLSKLRAELDSAWQSRVRRLEELIDGQRDFEAGAREARELMFVEKFKVSLADRSGGA